MNMFLKKRRILEGAGAPKRKKYENGT